MKGTRLWQEVRSPLISGYSRRSRPFWQDWLSALFVSSLLGCALVATVILLDLGQLNPGSFWLWASSPVGAAVGCVPAIWLSGKAGARHRWVWGAWFGTFAAVGCAMILSAYVSF